MPQFTAPQIPNRPKKAARDMSAWFGRNAGFRQHGSMNQFDARSFDISRLRKAAQIRADMQRTITIGRFSCLTGRDRRFSFLGQSAPCASLILLPHSSSLWPAAHCAVRHASPSRCSRTDF